jgi:hypothetical protein
MPEIEKKPETGRIAVSSVEVIRIEENQTT